MMNVPPDLSFNGNSLELKRCPHCNVDRPYLGVIGHRLETRNHLSQNVRYWKTFLCNNCGGLVLAASRGDNVPVSELYPSGLDQLPESVPQRAREYFEQAQNSLHAPAGSVILAACSVDSMLKEKG